MRCSGSSSLAISVCSVLLLAAPAAAHVVATPAFLPAGSSRTIELAGPNERGEPMTGFAVTVPPGLEIVHPHPVAGWEATVEGWTARWTGGSLPAGSEETFGVELEATAAPGVVQLEVEQQYAEGAVVRWPVSMTVTPPTESPSENFGRAAVVALLGLLVVAAVGALAWRRRTRTLQER